MSMLLNRHPAGPVQGGLLAAPPFCATGCPETACQLALHFELDFSATPCAIIAAPLVERPGCACCGLPQTRAQQHCKPLQ